MLGDNSEKSKNPLKKAMRRRNAKTVNFTAPTYIEASDVEYSTDEDDEHGDFFNDDETVESEDGEGPEQSEDIVVEPLRPKSQKEKPHEQAEGAEPQEKHEPERVSAEPRRSSEEFFDSDGEQLNIAVCLSESDSGNPAEPAVSRSRNGTVRNTDSFFKDDTAEPKKISLTPNLLRDESSNNSLANEWKDGRGSFESIDKASAPSEKSEKPKDDKKRKEKKPGMLSGLFKRKDKKSKSTDEDIEEPLSPGESTFRASPQPKTSMESLAQESRAKPQKQPSNKLQKQAPATMSPTSSAATEQTRDAAGHSIRQVSSQEARSFEESRSTVTSPASQPSPPKESFATPPESRDPLASQIDRPSSEAQRRAPYDSSERVANGQISATSPPQRFTPPTATRRLDQGAESPVDVSPVEGHIPISAPGLTPDTSNRGQSVSPLSPPSSPEADANDLKGTGATRSLDTLSVETPTWSDASLRSYLDEENDIRDLYIIVHDKSNIPPAGPDHPVTGRLFKEESRRLKEMNNQLDEMLVKWMSQRTRPSSSMRGLQSPTA